MSHTFLPSCIVLGSKSMILNNIKVKVSKLNLLLKFHWNFFVIKCKKKKSKRFLASSCLDIYLCPAISFITFIVKPATKRTGDKLCIYKNVSHSHRGLSTLTIKAFRRFFSIKRVFTFQIFIFILSFGLMNIAFPYIFFLRRHHVKCIDFIPMEIDKAIYGSFWGW